LLLALLESWVCGVSTRKVKRITEDLCGISVSKSTVSRLTAELDEDLELWRNRPLDRYYPYVYADGIYGKVRSEGRIRSEVALVVMGVDAKGRRQLLATDVVHEENQADYEALLEGLKQRGVEQVDLLIGDAHQGLQAAFARTFPGSGRQRCLVHLRRNLQQRVPKRHRQEMSGRLRVLLQAPHLPTAQRLFDELLDWTAEWDSRLADQLDQGGTNCWRTWSFQKLTGRRFAPPTCWNESTKS
jgi:putative transposase